MENTLTKEINIDLITPPEIDIRSAFSEGNIRELADSMHQVGLIEPVVVRNRNDRYEIIAGHRRYLAAKVLRWDKLTCIVRTLDDEAALTLRIHENLHRENMTPLDEANFVAVLHYEYKWSLAKICKQLSKSKNWIKDRIDIFQLPDNFKEALGNKSVKPAVALLLIQITNEPYRNELLKRAAYSGLTTAQARAWLTDWKGFPIAEGEPLAELQAFQENHTPISEHIQCKICDVDMKLGNYIYLMICPSCHMDIQAAKVTAVDPSLESQSQQD
jgi:ParB family chromosome partitioning protein